MTRKDYIQAAMRIKQYSKKERALLVGFCCKFFGADNPLFDEERFIQACEPKKEET